MKLLLKMRHIILFIGMLLCCFSSYSQEYYKEVNWPDVTTSSCDYVFIRRIRFSETETRVDFITFYTDHYILLHSPRHKHALYIRENNHGKRYKLRWTWNISDQDRMTCCYPNRHLYFSAIFEPMPKSEQRYISIFEGENGDWNFQYIYVENDLKENPVMEEKFKDKEREYFYKTQNKIRYKPKQSISKTLKKNPNFKIE